MSFSFDSPFLDEAGSWAEATEAFRAGLKFARQWQPDARTSLGELGEYPPAHLNEKGWWEILYWSPLAVRGLRVFLTPNLERVNQEEWGRFYLETARRVGIEQLGPHGFFFLPGLGQPGPDGLSFVFRRPGKSPAIYEFVDIQVSTSVMLAPPPRRFTINLIRNEGERPLFGTSGGWEKRLGWLLPEPKPDLWWFFKDEDEYQSRLEEALKLVVEFGLPALTEPGEGKSNEK